MTLIAHYVPDLLLKTENPYDLGFVFDDDLQKFVMRADSEFSYAPEFIALDDNFILIDSETEEIVDKSILKDLYQMDYLFLAVDGVLNGYHHTKNPTLSEELLDNLKTLVDETYAQIVLSSSWRVHFYYDKKGTLKSDTVFGKELLRAFEKRNIEIYDLVTNGYSSHERGLEIKRWLRANAGKKDKYLIIDDEDFDILDHHSKEVFIKTHYGNDETTKKDEGLSKDLVIKAVQYFNGKRK